ncbi:hypothetical protein EON65_06395 [archaeon]|nr:MAG: hypothetical protein EON65_06395 [archaeon]
MHHTYVYPIQDTTHPTPTLSRYFCFIDKAETAGANIPSVIGPQVDLGDGGADGAHTHTVAFEARQLKALFLRLHYY